MTKFVVNRDSFLTHFCRPISRFGEDGYYQINFSGGKIKCITNQEDVDWLFASYKPEEMATEDETVYIRGFQKLCAGLNLFREESTMGIEVRDNVMRMNVNGGRVSINQCSELVVPSSIKTKSFETLKTFKPVTLIEIPNMYLKKIKESSIICDGVDRVKIIPEDSGKGISMRFQQDYSSDSVSMKIDAKIKGKPLDTETTICLKTRIFDFLNPKDNIYMSILENGAFLFAERKENYELYYQVSPLIDEK